MAVAVAGTVSPSRAKDASTVRRSSVEREILYAWLALGFETVVTSLAAKGLAQIVLHRVELDDRMLIAADLFFIACLGCLMLGTFIYQVTRLGYLYRLRRHVSLSREELESVYDREQPESLAVLVPSYREEERVVRQTLMSAALMEYPGKRIALLIDDPPQPADPSDRRKLAAARKIAGDIDAMLREQEASYVEELESFRERSRHAFDSAFEAGRIAAMYNRAASWFEGQAAAYRNEDHYDALYVGRILLEPARDHRNRSAEIEARAASLSLAEAGHEYRRLAALFSARLTSFERKRYENLSHASNKAMNLNSYLGLLGKRVREVVRAGKLHLVESDDSGAHLVPDADFIITVDADSMLLGSYALALTHVMTQPEAAKYGVVQSPFSAVTGCPSAIERMAGAQTDVQWIASQGSTFFNASFWVGANALLRRAALDDICETVIERGYQIKRYIHDHTLVEDTESAIDMVVRGWEIYNYPERLSYSASPQDFGALVIQRRRWANGPLLIVPKLLRYAVSGSGRVGRLPEVFLRLYGLTSVSSAIAMALMVAIPFMDNQTLPLLWLVLATIPYYVLYASDLERCGYRWFDVFRMYSFNLLLIPVSIAGMLKSLRQAVTGERSPFTRTPKVPSRTAAPAIYTLIPVFAAPWLIYVALAGFVHGSYTFLAFGSINVAAVIYALASFIRFKNGWEDVRASLSMKLDAARANRKLGTQTAEAVLTARRAS
jgi:cellulose synthase (UDP-forming)